MQKTTGTAGSRRRDDVVVRALEERRVDRHDRPHAARLSPAANVTAWPSAMPTSKNRFGALQRRPYRAARHGRGDACNVFALGHEHRQAFAEHLRILRLAAVASWSRGRVVAQHATSRRHRCRARPPEALPLLRDDVHQPGPVIDRTAPNVSTSAHVVSVNRTVFRTALEQHARRQERLHISSLADHPSGDGQHARPVVLQVIRNLSDLGAETVVQRVPLNRLGSSIAPTLGAIDICR